jgi:hypothetical protein
MGILGTSYDDPQTQGILALAGNMIRGDVGGGLLGYGQAVQAAQNALVDRADKMQQIGLRNIQLQQAQQQFGFSLPVYQLMAQKAREQLGGAGAGAGAAPSIASQPAIAPSPGGPLGSGLYGIDVGGQPASSANAVTGNSSGVGNIFGVPFSVAMPAFAGKGMAGLADAAIQYNAPPDFVKMMRAANIDPDSPEGRSLLQGNLNKQNYIAPVSGRPGGTLTFADGRQEQLPSAIEGAQAVKNPDGSWTYRSMRNASGAITDATAAKEVGKARFDVQPTYNSSTNQWGFDTRENIANRANGGATGAPAGAAAPASTNADTDLPRIYASELQKAQGRLAEVQNDPRRTPQLLSAAQQDVTDLTRLTQKYPLQAGAPGNVAAVAVPAASIVPKPAPGQAESLTDLAKANTQRYTNTINQAADSATRVNVYDNILNLSKQGVATGPGQAWKNSVRGYVANAPLLSMVSQGWRNDVSGFQELNKFLYQNAQRNWQAAGGTGTDSQLEAFTKSNPNDKMFPQALQMMAQWGKAGELALQGKANAMQTWKDQQSGNLANMDQFERTWRNAFDPMLFQLKTMDPAQQNTQIQNMKMRDPKGYAALVQKAQVLKQLGGL